MNMIKFLGFLSVLALGAFMSISASADDGAKGECRSHPGYVYDKKDGKCHPSAAAPTNQSVDGKRVEADFRADCTAKKGTVYDAVTWNSMNPGAKLIPGQLHCHRDASWSMDAKK